MSGFDVFDRASHRANQWLDDLNAELSWDERYDAYIALRAVLQALRDVLPLEEVVDFGAQLPMIIRGFYYEGWTGAADGEAVARAVFRMLARRVSDGEIYHVGRRLPPALRPLWPEGSTKR